MHHIIGLKVAGLHLSEENLRSLNEHIKNAEESRHRLREHEVRCEEELGRLRNRGFDANVSLNHSLTTNNPRYLRNKPLFENLEPLNEQEYPIYGQLINYKFKSDKRRLSLFWECKRCLGVLIRRAGEIMMPIELLEKILSHLKYRDLKYFMHSVGEMKRLKK